MRYYGHCFPIFYYIYLKINSILNFNIDLCLFIPVQVDVCVAWYCIFVGFALHNCFSWPTLHVSFHLSCSLLALLYCSSIMVQLAHCFSKCVLFYARLNFSCFSSMPDSVLYLVYFHAKWLIIRHITYVFSCFQLLHLGFHHCLHMINYHQAIQLYTNIFPASFAILGFWTILGCLCGNACLLCGIC